MCRPAFCPVGTCFGTLFTMNLAQLELGELVESSSPKGQKVKDRDLKSGSKVDAVVL